MYRYLLFFALFAIVGCASSASQEAQAPEPAATLPTEPTGKASVNSQRDGFACDTGSSFGLFNEGKNRLSGHEIFVTDSQNRRKSLCDVVNDSGKDAVFFQFAGVTCIECMEKGEHYQEIIDSSRYQNIAWVVVITDLSSDNYTEAKYRSYMQEYGRGAIRVHDQAKLWKALSEDPTLPTRATTFAMNRNMDVVVVNRTGSSKDKIVEAAVELADEVN